METIGDRIKILRKDILKKSQKEFGEKIGLKPNSVSCIETGTNSLTEQTANAICREFNVNEEWLRTGNGDPYKKRTRNQELQSFANDVMEDVDESFKKRFILALSKLDESDWETLKKIADKLIKED